MQQGALRARQARLDEQQHDRLDGREADGRLGAEQQDAAEDDARVEGLLAQLLELELDEDELRRARRVRRALRIFQACRQRWKAARQRLHRELSDS